MNETHKLCDFCDKGRLVIKIPTSVALLICAKCVEQLRNQFAGLLFEAKEAFLRA